MSKQDISLTLVTTPSEEREGEGERGHEMMGRGRHRQKEGERERGRERAMVHRRERASERWQQHIMFVTLVVDRQRERGGDGDGELCSSSLTLSGDEPIASPKPTPTRKPEITTSVFLSPLHCVIDSEGGHDDKGKGKGDGFVILASCSGHCILALLSHVGIRVIDRERGRKGISEKESLSESPELQNQVLWERWRQRRWRQWRVELVAKWQGNKDGNNDGSGNGGYANAVAAQWPSSVVDECVPECTGMKVKSGMAAADKSELLGGNNCFFMQRPCRAGDGVEDGWLSDSGASIHRRDRIRFSCRTPIREILQLKDTKTTHVSVSQFGVQECLEGLAISLLTALCKTLRKTLRLGNCWGQDPKRTKACVMQVTKPKKITTGKGKAVWNCKSQKIPVIFPVYALTLILPSPSPPSCHRPHPVLTLTRLTLALVTRLVPLALTLPSPPCPPSPLPHPPLVRLLLILPLTSSASAATTTTTVAMSHIASRTTISVLVCSLAHPMTMMCPLLLLLPLVLTHLATTRSHPYPPPPPPPPPSPPHDNKVTPSPAHPLPHSPCNNDRHALALALTQLMT
ncbi:hypothetical protein OG21DRAFT_1527586 [Imleria badia]|nr:hypothetical protein OG21DRAFT_1527586 [Imleria badia]